MAGFLISTICLLTIRMASAAAPVMRRDSLEQVSLSAVGAAQHKRGAKEEDGRTLSKPKAAEMLEETANDYCNWDFPLGVDKTNHCHQGSSDTPVDQGGHTRIAELGDCMQAASESGATWQKGHEVPYDFYNFHPEGCFKDHCKNVKWNRNAAHANSTDAAIAGTSLLDGHPLGADHEICYFFNPSPKTPTAIESGIPVCSRKKYLLGTPLNGTPPTTNGGCPADYEVVRYQSTCHRVAGCIGSPAAQLFRTNEFNSSLRDIFPDYCYIEAKGANSSVEAQVFFNAPRQGMGTPTKPVGTPICNVSTTTLWNGKLPDPEIAPFETNEASYNYGTMSTSGGGVNSANANGENAAVNAAADGSHTTGSGF